MLYFNLLDSVIVMLCEPRDGALQPRVSPTLSTSTTSVPAVMAIFNYYTSSHKLYADLNHNNVLTRNVILIARPSLLQKEGRSGYARLR